MSADCDSTEDIKTAVFHKLVLFKSARDTLNKELYTFTQQTVDEVEEYLSCSDHNQDNTDLLKTLDVKYQVIKELMVIFEDLRSGANPQRLRTCPNHRTSRSLQCVLQSDICRKRQNGFFVPNVLRFGLLLQNAILAHSLTKTVQLTGTKLCLQRETLQLKGPTEEFTCRTVSKYDAGMEEIHQEVSEISEMEDTGYKKQESVIKEAPQNITGNFMPAGISPNQCRSGTSYILQQQFGSDLEVQHQKQTSSQLVRFLKVSGKMVECTLTSAERSFVLIQQRKHKTQAADQERTALHTKHNSKLFSEIKFSVPVFKVKTSSSGFVTYSCMIATHSELWDVADVSTEAQNSLKTLSHVVPASDDFIQASCSSDESVTSEQTELQCDSEMFTSSSVDEDEASVRIPKFQIKKFEEMPVLITHVVSPSDFYIQHKDANLQKLSEMMTSKSCESYAWRSCVPDIGTYVMAWFSDQDMWCRGQVSKICGRSNRCSTLEGVSNLEVEIRRVDFGDSAHLSLSDVKDLCGEAADIPVQALRVSLANVRPVSGVDWTCEAVDWFKEKVNSRILYARLYPEPSRVLVELFLEKGKIGTMRRGASLSLRLAQNGHARHEQMKNMKLKRGPAQEQWRKRSTEWQKYLISCYSQTRK